MSSRKRKAQQERKSRSIDDLENLASQSMMTSFLMKNKKAVFFVLSMMLLYIVDLIITAILFIQSF